MLLTLSGTIKTIIFIFISSKYFISHDTHIKLASKCFLWSEKLTVCMLHTVHYWLFIQKGIFIISSHFSRLVSSNDMLLFPQHIHTHCQFKHTNVLVSKEQSTKKVSSFVRKRKLHTKLLCNENGVRFSLYCWKT